MTLTAVLEKTGEGGFTARTICKQLGIDRAKLIVD
jgi:hypothetical protein